MLYTLDLHGILYVKYVPLKLGENKFEKFK